MRGRASFPFPPLTRAYPLEGDCTPLAGRANLLWALSFSYSSLLPQPLRLAVASQTAASELTLLSVLLTLGSSLSRVLRGRGLSASLNGGLQHIHAACLFRPRHLSIVSTFFPRAHTRTRMHVHRKDMRKREVWKRRNQRRGGHDEPRWHQSRQRPHISYAIEAGATRRYFKCKPRTNIPRPDPFPSIYPCFLLVTTTTCLMSRDDDACVACVLSRWVEMERLGGHLY